MRDIKFRALIKWPNLEAGWIYYEPLVIPYAFYAQNDLNEDKRAEIIVKNLEWTGLKDKNGSDVYESDWLQSDDGRKYFIVWAEDEARFELEHFEDHSLRHIKDVKVMTIIGNDYENKRS